jgi:hypothetical protein
LFFNYENIQKTSIFRQTLNRSIELNNDSINIEKVDYGKRAQVYLEAGINIADKNHNISKNKKTQIGCLN